MKQPVLYIHGSQILKSVFAIMAAVDAYLVCCINVINNSRYHNFLETCLHFLFFVNLLICFLKLNYHHTWMASLTCDAVGIASYQNHARASACQYCTVVLLPSSEFH